RYLPAAATRLAAGARDPIAGAASFAQRAERERRPSGGRGRGGGMKRVGGGLWLWASFALSSCSNNPYPSADDAVKVRSIALGEAPKTLDPAVSYSALDHAIIGNVYDTLLEYHYLDRPFELIPGLAEAVPEPQPRADGRVAYRFRLRPGMRF